MGAGWLVNPSLDRRSFTYHPEVQALILDLMKADGSRAKLTERVRRRAIAWHSGRKSAEDRAFAWYHCAMLGEPLPHVDLPSVRRDLARVVQHLPAQAQSLLQAVEPDAHSQSREDQKGGAAHSFETASDEEWRNYLEGVGGAEGQGDRLVARGKLTEAIELYRNRPTRPPGVPPTFVIQALTDAALWDSKDVDLAPLIGGVQRMAAHGKGRISPKGLKLIYWVTRYCLVSDPKSAPRLVRPFLAAIFERLSTTGSTFALASLASVVEALSPKQGPIVPVSWLARKRRIAAETRIYLVHRLHYGALHRFAPPLDSIVVIQKDWARRVTVKRSSPFGQSFRPPQGTQKLLQSLDHARFAEVSKVMRGLRRAVPVSLQDLERDQAVDLLRGMTIEFHKPLRYALAALLPGKDPAQSSSDSTAHAFALQVLRKVSEWMTIGRSSSRWTSSSRW